MSEPLPAPSTRPPLRKRLQTLMVDLTIFALVLVGFVLAIQLGVKVQGAGATAGTWAAAYIATKITQPLRIMATLAVTPLVMRLLPRRKPRERR